MSRAALVLSAIFVVLLSLSVEAARGRGNRVHSFAALGHHLQPEVVAHSLAKLEEEWRFQALAAVDSSSKAGSTARAVAADRLGSTAPKQFQRSCDTVVSAVLQASGGDREVVQQYLDDVCGQEELKGWRSDQCRWLTEVITVSMTADEYVNREELDRADLCRHLWLRISREERTRAVNEAKRKAAEEAAREAKEEAAKKKAAEAAKKAVAEAKRKAAEEASRRAKDEAAKKVREEVAKRAEESAQHVKDAAKKAAEEAALAKVRKVREAARKKVAEQKRKEHQEREAARKKAAEERQKKTVANAKRREEKAKKAAEAKHRAEVEARNLEQEAERLQQKVLGASDVVKASKPATTGVGPRLEEHKKRL